MPQIKRYTIPTLATSIALLGVACAQPAGATTRAPAARSTYENGCSLLHLKGTPLKGDDKSGARVLAGCFTGGSLSLVNTIPAGEGSADAIIVWDDQKQDQPLSYTVTSLSPNGPQAEADDVTAAPGAKPSTTGGVLFPWQVLTITSDKPWTATTIPDVVFTHNRIAAEAGGAAEVMEEIFIRSASKAIADAEGAKFGVAAYECADGIWKYLHDSSATTAPPQTSKDWVTFTEDAAHEIVSAHNNAATAAACQEVLKYFGSAEEEQAEKNTPLSFFKDLVDKTFGEVLDYADEHWYDL